MTRLIHALAAMGAALVFAGCEGAEQTQLSNPETGELCDSPGEPEQKYTNDKEYNHDGCTRTERMANVLAFRDMRDSFDNDSAAPLDEDSTGGLGTTKQPLNIPFGVGWAVTVDGFGNVTGSANSGHCTPDSTWTTARPLIGNCIIPKGMNRIHWEVWPGYGSDVAYMRDRARAAFAAWSRSVTFCGKTFTPQLQSAANSEQPLITTEDERYFTAAVSIFPEFAGQQESFLGKTYLDDSFITPKTPIRNGIRYWEWQYMPIGVNHDILEGIKADSCLSPTDPNRVTKVAHATEWVLAHEFGHTFGLPHFNSGIMRPGSFTNCAEIFSTQTIVARSAAMTPEERALVADTRDSSGFSVHTVPELATCQSDLQNLPTGSFEDVSTL